MFQLIFPLPMIHETVIKLNRARKFPMLIVLWRFKGGETLKNLFNYFILHFWNFIQSFTLLRCITTRSFGLWVHRPLLKLKMLLVVEDLYVLILTYDKIHLLPMPMSMRSSASSSIKLHSSDALIGFELKVTGPSLACSIRVQQFPFPIL